MLTRGVTTSLAGAPATADFKELFQNVPSAVTVVTAMEDRQPHATTVSSFCSLSAEPALVLVALALDSRLLPMIERTARFGINVLAADQEWIGLACASKRADKMGGIDWRDVEGLPKLVDTAGWLDCDLERTVWAGDHKIVIGAPRAIDVAPVVPLIYHRKAFCVATAAA